MSLPFTPGEFFAVFRDYNTAVWPLQVLFNALAVGALALVFAPRRFSGRLISAILALLWAWMGVVYHLAFFLPVNPAAGLFGAAFLAGAALFAWEGVARNRLRFECRDTGRCIAGLVLAGYALLVYPVLSYMLRAEVSAMPTFGLPCPTTIFTLGLLAFLRPPYPRMVFVVPMLWTLVGTQAALLLGVYEDIGLLAAGLAGLWLVFLPSNQVRHA